MKIGKPKPPPGRDNFTPIRKKGDPMPEGYKGIGRPTLYRPEYCDVVRDTFARAESWEKHVSDKGTAQILPVGPLPTLDGIAVKLGVSRRVLDLWRDAHPEFRDACDFAMTAQSNILQQNAAVGIGGNSTVFMLKCNHGMREPTQDNPVQDLAQQLGNLIEKMPS